MLQFLAEFENVQRNLVFEDPPRGHECRRWRCVLNSYLPHALSQAHNAVDELAWAGVVDVLGAGGSDRTWAFNWWMAVDVNDG